MNTTPEDLVPSHADPDPASTEPDPVEPDRAENDRAEADGTEAAPAPERTSGGPSTARILLAGGGTAGHVAPLLATAAAIREKDPSAQIVVLGTREGLEADLVPAAGFELSTIAKVPFPRRPNADAVRFPGRLRAVTSHVRAILDEHEITAVAGFGGYVCPPAYLAAARNRIPVVVHEANRRPGLANRLGARRASAVLTAFDTPGLRGSRRIGMPMRAKIAHLDRRAHHEDAARSFDLDPNRPILLVTGGSLGAQRINEAIAEAAQSFLDAGIQLLHITGRGKAADLNAAPGHRVIEYCTAMEDAYAAADAALTRSGAGTVSELTAVGLPAFLVPLPIGNGEQALNGQDVVTAGGALMIPDAELTADRLRAEVLPVLTDQARLSHMAEASSAFGIRDAAEVLADIVLTAARKD